MSDLPVFIGGLIVGLVVGLFLGRLRQTGSIDTRVSPNLLSEHRPSAAPPASAPDRPREPASTPPSVGRQALLTRLGTDLVRRLDRSEQSARRRDP